MIKRRSFFVVFNLILALILGLVGTYYAIRFFTRGQACFNLDQIANDSRCLYIYNGKVFEKGTRDNPHKGHQCGIDVSSLIPKSHMLDQIAYLDPNYLGDVCASESNPTAAPTSPPQPTNTPAPTNTPVPINTPVPNNRSTPTPTLIPPSETGGGASTPTLNPSPTSASLGSKLSPTKNTTLPTQLPITGIKETVVSLAGVGLVILGILGLIW